MWCWNVSHRETLEKRNWYRDTCIVTLFALLVYYFVCPPLKILPFTLIYNVFVYKWLLSTRGMNIFIFNESLIEWYQYFIHRLFVLSSVWLTFGNFYTRTFASANVLLFNRQHLKKKKCIGYMNLCKSQMPFMLTQITVCRHSTLISKSPVED